MTTHIEDLCKRYEKYRALGLSVDAEETLTIIKEGVMHLKQDDYCKLKKQYVHVFSHIPPLEGHICYEGSDEKTDM